MRLLVIEDEATLADIIRRALAEDGHAVDTAGRISDARELIRLGEYDVLIADIGLPDGSGLDLCAELRDAGDRTPVLLLTARDSLSDKVAGLDGGADDYLTKPFDVPELAARVRALLRRPAETLAPVLEVGDIRLDPATRRVWRGAIGVPVTAKEFALLDYLMRRPGQVLSRSELLEHVWDMNYDGMSNVVDVHVANLRRKLGGVGASVPIETLRGAGYRLVDANGLDGSN